MLINLFALVLPLANSNKQKMKTQLNGILTLMLALIVQVTIAQTKTVTGTVTDDSGLPLPGANVLVKGTNNGTQTDFDGNYSIEVSSNQQLEFSYIGFQVQTARVGNKSEINIQMESGEALDEVFVVAYGTASKESFTGSADIVGSKELANRNVTSPIAAIEGNATGVQFTAASGQPGSNPSIVIRGVGTLNGSTDPLFVVDGVPFDGNLNTINQEDIESFTVLKDAASTSLYGSRAANGVVLITTKQGVKGDIRTNFSTQFGIVDYALPFYDEATPGQYYESMWQGLRNSPAGAGAVSSGDFASREAFASARIFNNLGYNPFNVPNSEIVGLDGRINPNAEVIYQGLDWYDELARTGIRQNYNLNIAGGGENSKVFFSASYLDEEGYVVTSDFNRLTTRVNGEFNVTDRLTVGGSANISIAESNGPASTGSSIANPFGFARGIGSIYPVFLNDRDGNLVRDAGGAPIFDNGEGFPDLGIGSRPRNQGRHALQELILNDNQSLNNTIGFRYNMEYEIMDGLKASLRYGRDINELFNKRYENQIIGDAQPTGRYREVKSRRQIENFTQLLTYERNFDGLHNLDVTLGHESFDRTFATSTGLMIEQTAEGIFEFDNFAQPVSLSGSSTQKTVESYFSRLNYNFDNKYYISASARRDGSSVFGRNTRWGNFYSVGASWRIDREDFIQDLGFVDQLKLRASFGQVGNDNLGDFFLSQPRFSLTSNAGSPAITWSDIGNANLQWETVDSYDVAVEFGLFKRINGSIEYWQRNSTELLYDLPIALSNGLNSFPANVADMRNSGWEFSLGGSLVQTNDFDWNLRLIGSTQKNRITRIPDPFIDGTKRWDEGRSRFEFFLRETAGVDPATGDQLFFMYEFDQDGNSIPVLDADGNHELTNDWQETERTYTGKTSLPDFIGSVNNTLSYKGFNLNVLVTYQFGGHILDNGYSAMMHSGNFGTSLHPDIANAWMQPGDITDVPRMENGNPNLVIGSSTRFLTDASFWSLRNVNLGYTFQDGLVDALGVDNLTLSVTGENLYISSARRGMNPQLNISGTQSGNTFNPARIFSLGLNVSF